MTVPARRPEDQQYQKCVDQKCVDALDRLDEFVFPFAAQKDDIATVREALERLRERAEAAEAEVHRLTEGLREIERMTGAGGSGQTPAFPIAQKARDLLAASPSDEGGAK